MTRQQLDFLVAIRNATCRQSGDQFVHSSFRLHKFCFLFSEAQGFAEYNIITNQPPTGGTCDVTPKTGEELETRFTFSCSGWQDEHEPLTYEMFFSHPSDSNKDPGSSPNGVLFFFGPSLAKAEFSFTAGKEEEDRLIEIVVVIKDAYGESVENKLQIQVFVCFFFSCLLCRCCK